MIKSKSSQISSFKKPPIRVGLIGVTGYGQAYYEGINRLVKNGRVRWGAVTIINPAQAVEQVKFFEKESIPIYASYTEMLETEKDNLDWVCIPTAIGWHTRMTLDCLKLGLQVMVEKPLAPTLQEVAILQAAEKMAGIKVGVGFQHSYQKETWDIKEMLVNGKIGDVLVHGRSKTVTLSG